MTNIALHPICEPFNMLSSYEVARLTARTQISIFDLDKTFLSLRIKDTVLSMHFDQGYKRMSTQTVKFFLGQEVANRAHEPVEGCTMG